MERTRSKRRSIVRVPDFRGPDEYLYALHQGVNGHYIGRCGPRGSVRKQLERGADAYVEFALTHPAYFKAMYSGTEARLDRTETDQFKELLDLIGSAQASGDLPPGDRHRLARTLWAGMHGIADLAVLGQILPADVQSIARLGFRALLDGLAPRNGD